MPKSTLTGSRVRARRIDLGLKQADLAAACGISPSYLNLIEHNRRRVSGERLDALARALAVEPAQLRDGADQALLDEMRAAAGTAGAAELDRAEELAGRFPGWADLIRQQAHRIEGLERAIETLSDRLTQDPFLSASLHDILSSATAIRSTSAILADEGEVAPEWRARFHENLRADSERLAEASRALAGYLDAEADVSRGTATPQEEFEDWLADRDFRVPELEEGDGPGDDAILAGAEALTSGAARALAEGYLGQYRADARALPRATLEAAVAETGIDPGALAQRLGLGLHLVMRRLTTIDAEVGLAIADVSGTLLFRKPVEGLALPRFGAGCPLWPLYQVIARPGAAIREDLEFAGQPPRRYRAWAVTEARVAPGFGGPQVLWAYMLVTPLRGEAGQGPPLAVGTSCRICPREACPARREPSVLAQTA
jgi:predicted transcriptional regulator/DNA-binding transcriptional regulator YdaS (Cro superfamily)